MSTPITAAESKNMLDYLVKQDAAIWNKTEYKTHGYHAEGAVIIAWDNTSGNCWTEEFKTETEALHWLYNS